MTKETLRKRSAASEAYYELLYKEYKDANSDHREKHCCDSRRGWVSAEWPHNLERDGMELLDEGEPVECVGFDENRLGLPCEFCQRVETAAMSARDSARDALNYAYRGNWKIAAYMAKTCRDLEVKHTDWAHVWGRFYDTAVKAREAIESIQDPEVDTTP